VKEIFDLVRGDLEKVEQELTLQSLDAIQPVAQIGHYLQSSGGKRLRPALLLLSSKFCGYSGDAAIRLAAVMELIHTATLVHDDVIDKAETRRGRASINHRWGNHLSVLAGDWFYMQAFSVALRERNFRILDLLIGLTQAMVEGELLQLQCLGKADLTEDEYFDLAYRKTACLFSACLRIGALLGSRSEEEENKLGNYGLNLGLAFQLVDDILDFTSSEAKLGKPVGSDLREGKATLPFVYLLKRLPEHDVHRVAKAFERGDFQTAVPPEILELAKQVGALSKVRERAMDFAQQAKRCLEGFPSSPYHEALLSLPDFIVERES
jgi:octaprenyl-diphosphate synthase